MTQIGRSTELKPRSMSFQIYQHGQCSSVPKIDELLICSTAAAEKYRNTRPRPVDWSET